MKYSAVLFLGLLAATSLIGCDDDDPSDVANNCQREAAFEIDGEGICATGTFVLSASTTSITLTGENNETLSIMIDGTEEDTYTIPVGRAVYIDRNGEAFASTEGGTIDIRDNVSDMDASFSFSASSVTSGTTVEVTNGVIEDLPSR